MQIRILLTFFCILSATNIFANNLTDSVGVENNNGKEVVIHKVDPKETYYSLARRYSVTPKAIMDYNDNKALQIGMLLKIPTSRVFGEVKTPSVSASASSNDIIEYKVGPKEYLYSIAKKFNTTIEDIRELNGLKSNNLTIGQLLKVRQLAPKSTATEQPVVAAASAPVAAPVSKPSSPVTIAPADTSTLDAETRLKIASNKYGLREQNERGVAVWIDDASVDGTKMLALHHSAPIGTVIKITNPMTNKSTFAKVVGKYTENETTKDVIIVLTKAVADLVGALDKRFQVNIVYGIPNEE